MVLYSLSFIVISITMVLVFNESGTHRQFANPYGVKFRDCYFEFAHAHYKDGNLVATRAEKSSSIGKFLISASSPRSDSVRVCAVLFSPGFVDLNHLISSTNYTVGVINALIDRLDVSHNDLFEVLRILNPDLKIYDSYFISGGIVSLDLESKRLQAGLGSTYGVFPRSLLIDAFTDLAERLGCNFEPVVFSGPDHAPCRPNSDASFWYDAFKVPLVNH